MEKVFDFRLRNAPTPVKALALGYILALSLAYVYAIGNIAMVVGLSPKDIMVHYYGAEKKIEEKPAVTGEAEFSLDDTAPAAEPVAELGPRPSFKNLVGAGHFHLFGMSSFFFGLTLLGLFTNLKTNMKTLLVFIPFIAVILDNLSFLATRFLGPAFAYLTAISGAFMGLTFAALWCAVLYEVIQKPEVKA